MGDTEYTSISVPKAVKDELEAHRDDRPWGAYLETLLHESDVDAHTYATVSGFDADAEHQLRVIVRDAVEEIRR